MSGSGGGGAIEEGMVPGVGGDGGILEVGSVPVVDAVGLGDEGGKSLIGRGVGADIELVEVEDAGDALDGLFGDLMFGAAQLLEDGGGHHADEQGEDRQDDEEFEQREAGLPAAWIAGFDRQLGEGAHGGPIVRWGGFRAETSVFGVAQKISERRVRRPIESGAVEN